MQTAKEQPEPLIEQHYRVHPRLLTTRDVMVFLGLKDPQKVYDLIRDGKLPALNNGTDKRATWRFRAEDVEAYLDSRRVGPLPSAAASVRVLPVPSMRFLKDPNAS